MKKLLLTLTGLGILALTTRCGVKGPPLPPERITAQSQPAPSPSPSPSNSPTGSPGKGLKNPKNRARSQ